MNEMTLGERISQDGITLDYELTGVNEGGTHMTYRVTFRCNDREFTLPDPWVTNSEPTVFDVLDLVTGTCSVIDQVHTRSEWAAEYLGDEEPQEGAFSERDFKTWNSINAELREFLGADAHHDYLYDTDRSK